MGAFLYSFGLQCKLDIRSKALLITCYVVPLLFFGVMGGIFTSINPVSKSSLIQSMIIMGVSMGAFIGLPPTLTDIYSSDIKKAYKANGVPLFVGVATTFLSAFVHLFIMSLIIYAVAPLAFDAAMPENKPLFFISLALFIAVSLSIGCVLGLAMKSQSKLTMFSQLLFLPSIMLSGIMFPADMLPQIFEKLGMIFPASWGYKLMTDAELLLGNLVPLLIFLILALIGNFLFLRKLKSE